MYPLLRKVLKKSILLWLVRMLRVLMLESMTGNIMWLGKVSFKEVRCVSRFSIKELKYSNWVVPGVGVGEW
jgi:hypothetical protein